jgi:hypothetical protein
LLSKIKEAMIELSSGTTSSSFPSIGLVSSPPRSVCSTTNSAVVVQTRLHKFPCQEIEKIKQKYRIQHTSCFTHLQTLINKHRVQSNLIIFSSF